ncbi:MAG: response regulator transcription factor [Fimbriimonadaceae bacterium]|nr:response regulator transcription factor [Chitinophagales bacterium]
MSRKIKCLIVDDEPLAQQVIETYIVKLNTLELVKKCNNAMEAFEALQQHTIDVMFLDVQMPVITGIEFLRSLKNTPHIILTTAYPNFALEGFELNVTDYLLKPISFERFLKAVNKVTEKISAQNYSATAEPNNQPDYLFVKENSKLVRINFSDIDHIECMKDYAKIFTKQRMIVTHHTMKKFEEVLPSEIFIRVHKSYIVAMPSILSIYGNMIETPKTKIPIGANYKDELMKVISG